MSSEVIIPGPVGRLEGRYRAGARRNSPQALILHPHPKHGGTMHNKVVYAMFNSFADRGFSTLRFNFRGVGKSQGSYDRGEGELSDAASAMDWLQSVNPDATSCWVAGFSFGAWIGMQLLMRRPEVVRFISIAPPANMYDFSFLAPCPSSGLIVLGDKDEIVTVDSVDALVSKIKKQKGLAIDFRVMAGANHFFNERVEELAGIVGGYIDSEIHARTPMAARR